MYVDLKKYSEPKVWKLGVIQWEFLGLKTQEINI